LPKPDFENVAGDEMSGEPQNENEEKLLAIFKEILGHQVIGTQNNFFELGGDSIMSIQVIAKANQAGLRLTPKQLFENPTVAGLASVAGQGVAVVAEQGIVHGAVELTPIQNWFFDSEFESPHHWNQSLLLSVNESLDADAMTKAIDAILKHHDMFRARYQKENEWQQVLPATEEHTILHQFDVRDLAESDQQKQIEEKCAELQSSFDLQNGPVIAFAQFECGDTSRLFIAVHHLVMDGVSWRILLEDVQNAYQQAKENKEITLPAKSTSFQYWAEQLKNFAASQTVADEASYWTHYERSLVAPIPVDVPANRQNNFETDAKNVNDALTVEETKSLIQELPTKLDATINDILLTAFVDAYALWSGKRSLLIDMEGHGREMLFDDVDISRTIGWFTVLYPLFLKASRAQNQQGAVHSIKSQLQQVPHHGIGYGLLRYGHNEVSEKLAKLPAPEISFNYLGQFDQLLDSTSPFQPAMEDKGPERGPQAKRENLIDVTANVAGEQLRVSLTFNETIHRHETIQRLLSLYIQALRRLISPDHDKQVSPSLPKTATAKMDKRQLGKVLGQLNKGKGKTI
jgi:non-ribosomal peptide synthase protein (TIGR01720 family)